MKPRKYKGGRTPTEHRDLVTTIDRDRDLNRRPRKRQTLHSRSVWNVAQAGAPGLGKRR